MSTSHIASVLSLSPTSPFSVYIKGQFISLLIAGTGVFATYLSNNDANFPTLLNSLTYLLLSTYMIRMYLCSSQQKNHDRTPRKPIYIYIAAAILDMEANYLVILAYNYTNITSVMLLDCFTIPSAMVVSYLFLQYKYSYLHAVGALICICGLGIIVATDMTFESDSNLYGSDPLLGDIYCLVGSFLYASSNVLQEHVVKTNNREEYLGLLGSFGVIIASIQFVILDLPKVESTIFTFTICSYIFGFVACLFLVYASASIFLIDYDATLFNMSLLTSDVYAVIFSYLLTGEVVHWPYFIAFGIVVVGLFIYHREPSPSHSNVHRQSDRYSINDIDRISNPSDLSRDYSLVDNLSSHESVHNSMSSQPTDDRMNVKI